MDPQTPGRGSDTVRDPIATHLLVWVGFPVLGGAAGWVLASVADWVAALPWVPFQGPFELVARFTGPVATLVLVGLGVVAGVALALTAYGEMLTVTVSNQAVRLTRDNVSQDIDRGVVATVFTDGKELVLVGTAGQELAREKSDLGSDGLEAAFVAHGYPWQARDPHASSFSRWVEDAHDLPAGANAMFRARQHALDKGDAHDIRELRGELARLGVVVRDEKKRQYWRRAGAAGPG